MGTSAARWCSIHHPVTVSLWFTPWVLTEFAVVSAAIAIGAGICCDLPTDGRRHRRTRDDFAGVFYATFIVYIVAFPRTTLPIH
jgi:hypothetical protein